MSADRYHNPFQGIDISVPNEIHDLYQRYCQTHSEGGRVLIDQKPFLRMVDLWFLSICVAARLGLKSADLSKSKKTTKIIEGYILGNDPWRVHALMLLAIRKTGDVEIVAKPREMMKLANGLAVAGLPKVVEMLTDGAAEPIWNLSDALDKILRE